MVLREEWFDDSKMVFGVKNWTFNIHSFESPRSCVNEDTNCGNSRLLSECAGTVLRMKSSSRAGTPAHRHRRDGQECPSYGELQIVDGDLAFEN